MDAERLKLDPDNESIKMRLICNAYKLRSNYCVTELIKIIIDKLNNQTLRENAVITLGLDGFDLDEHQATFHLTEGQQECFKKIIIPTTGTITLSVKELLQQIALDVTTEKEIRTSCIATIRNHDPKMCGSTLIKIICEQTNQLDFRLECLKLYCDSENNLKIRTDIVYSSIDLPAFMRPRNIQHHRLFYSEKHIEDLVTCLNQDNVKNKSDKFMALRQYVFSCNLSDSLHTWFATRQSWSNNLQQH